jgi:ribosomal protein S18 acetylase RimI-like enzyme
MEIYKATLHELDDVADLFDQYRQFYQQEPDYAGCRAYIQQRMENDESVIFVAKNEQGELVGFTQLYHTFCSVARAPILTLYDLYIAPSARRLGIGRALMNQAKVYAQASGASRLQLETAVDNSEAQALYESLGYERDQNFYTYQLAL